MDPFTQRMLERAKARREKLDTQLSNAGHDPKKRRSPLKDANAILAQAPVLEHNVAAKPVVKDSPVKQSPIKSPRKFSPTKIPITTQEGKVSNKENGETQISGVRSKLQRLGKLYSEDCSRELSSPIHRTEEKFAIEEESTDRKAAKPGARLGRLAALASTINNWEDDLSHPTLIKSVESKASKVQAKFNEQVRNGSGEPQPGTSGLSKQPSTSGLSKQPSTSGLLKHQSPTGLSKMSSTSGLSKKPSTSSISKQINSNGSSSSTQVSRGKGSPTKQLKWDQAVLETLEAQGFTRTTSNSRLVYDYKGCSQGSNSDSGKSSAAFKWSNNDQQLSDVDKRSLPKVISSNSKFDGNDHIEGKKPSDDKNISRSPTKTSHASINKNNRTPENNTQSVSSSTSSDSNLIPNTSLTPKFGYSSPKSPIQSPGSVLSKASMFESKAMEPKKKDPAEMTLSERMALFERNKGEAPLIPKAPLSMSVSKKQLEEKDPQKSHHTPEEKTASSAHSKADVLSKKVIAQRALFEHGGQTQELENNILRNSQNERQRELEMLRSRFNRNKEMAQAAAGSCIRTSESSDGKPNSPKNSPVCPVRPTPALETIPPPPPPPLGHLQDSVTNGVPITVKTSPVKRQVAKSLPKLQQNKTQSDIKRIRVSPPKAGHLYPNLSDNELTETETEGETEYTVGDTEAETATLDEKTETETEAEYYLEQEDTEYDSTEESEGIGNTSLGRSILRVVSEQSVLNKKRSIDPDPDSTTSDISVLEEMDEYLDGCLALQDEQNAGLGAEGPTPPKLNRAGKSPSATSHSFKYTQGQSYRSPIKIATPRSSPRKGEQYVVEGDNHLPLMHSVSFYRRQQSQTPKTPVRHVTRIPEPELTTTTSSSQFDERDEYVLVQEKVKHLLEEVCKQQTVISQASQALNLCNATVEFSGSREQVEGERLLLVATHRRQAALHEVQRLKVEGTLRPAIPGSPELQECGSLTISAITLPLKQNYFRNMDAANCYHFVCLVRHLDHVVATPVVDAEPGDSCLRFSSTLKLQDLYSDFKITLELYSLETRAEVLPHEIKYHIHNSKKGSGKTPKKLLKQESRLLMPSVQSPAGPSAVRSPAFSLTGYVIFSLREVQRQQWTLNKVPQSSPLEGRLQMHVSCELSVSVEHRGFLSMFDDVSGFGAWHRRWCLLKGSALSYWKYPDDERKKTPIGSLDLQGVSTIDVGLVSRDICARPNTFLLETIRPAEPGDLATLVMVRMGPQTIIRHLLSADTKEERLEWCSKLNKTLSLMRAWGGTSSS
ncbi:anillin isoform X1 [Neodiprion lecontei]|uniref:Anillin isoform X1 n=1 Tax=Neodiprion lecontei TaxID=441921 RepID=A0ABM3FE74_NEOLC|nr:anillin isoform X1 [Neodiprion lecontei]